MRFIPTWLATGAIAVTSAAHAADDAATTKPAVLVNTSQEPPATGKFEPTWQSLAQYQTPDWFRDAKFGIWAHWGPQCQPEQGDWYARTMYMEGNKNNKYHVQWFGHPSQFGFKDVIHQWTADQWDPERTVALYKRVGAQYFFALANHHDNLDLWDSKYQPWNSVAVGPKKDLIGGWAKAARANGLKFGVSVHAAHAWSWYETAQGADKNGPLAGVPYDGKLTKADGKGTWWDGLDPQDLYEQRHTPGRPLERTVRIWDWEAAAGVTLPDQAYCDKFYDRTVDLINKYQPDLIYFDDTGLPLWPASDAGLQVASHFYNQNMANHGGNLEAVIFGKVLTPEQRKCMVWDIERGQSPTIEPEPWQTDTCLGNWHYDRPLYERGGYKTAKTVVQTLVDVVSKNGNLLLNVPLRGNGSIDEKEAAVLEGVAAWMDVNKSSIFGTRPWKVLGEGPALASQPAIRAQGFNEGKGKAFGPLDVRFATKGDDVLFATVLGKPTSAISITSLGTAAKRLDKSIATVTLLGSEEKLDWKQGESALSIELPKATLGEIANVFKIELK